MAEMSRQVVNRMTELLLREIVVAYTSAGVSQADIVERLREMGVRGRSPNETISQGRVSQILKEGREDRIEVGPDEASQLAAGLTLLRLAASQSDRARRAYDVFASTLLETDDLEEAVAAAENAVFPHGRREEATI